MIVVFVLAKLAGALTVALAQSIDPHRLYEQRCSGCHAMHASEFVRDSLTVADGKLVGRRSGREVLTFLESGHGRLTGAEAKAVVAQLTSIEASDGLYQQKCRICHDRAVNLARTELIVMGGRLAGRYSKRDIETFLAGHGRLTAGELPTIVDMLKRQIATAQGQ